MNSSRETNSTAQRNKGNVKYKEYNTLRNQIKNTSSLTEAIELYEQAFENAYSFDDKYKVLKNIGLACERMLEVLTQSASIKAVTFEKYYYYAKKMASSYNDALIYGPKVLRTSEYYAQVDRIQGSLTNIFFKISGMNKISHLESIAKLIQNHRKIFYYLIALIARYYFNEGKVYLDNKQYTIAKNYFNQSQQIINIYYSPSKDIISDMTQITIDEFLDVLDSCNFYLRRAQVKSILKEGKKYFKKAIFDEAEIDMEYCFICLNKYREALIYFQEDKQNEDRKASDIELEGICVGKIAYVMYRVFKNEQKAYALAMESITLGLSLWPKNIMSEKWYMKSKDIAEAIRDKRAKTEGKGNEKAYLEFLKKNKAIVDKIEEEAKKGYESYVKFCLSQYPYGNIKDKIDVNQLKELAKKKVLLKLIAHYHPDGQSRNNEEETKIYFIKQEITKYCSNFYNEMKGE